jgi:hypothetical protein
VCESPEQAAHYHIFGFYVACFKVGPSLGWLQFKGVNFGQLHFWNDIFTNSAAVTKQLQATSYEI